MGPKRLNINGLFPGPTFRKSRTSSSGQQGPRIASTSSPSTNNKPTKRKMYNNHNNNCKQTRSIAVETGDVGPDQLTRLKAEFMTQMSDITNRQEVLEILQGHSDREMDGLRDLIKFLLDCLNNVFLGLIQVQVNLYQVLARNNNSNNNDHVNSGTNTSAPVPDPVPAPTSMPIMPLPEAFTSLFPNLMQHLNQDVSLKNSSQNQNENLVEVEQQQTIEDEIEDQQQQIEEELFEENGIEEIEIDAEDQEDHIIQQPQIQQKTCDNISQGGQRLEVSVDCYNFQQSEENLISSSSSSNCGSGSSNSILFEPTSIEIKNVHTSTSSALKTGLGSGSIQGQLQGQGQTHPTAKPLTLKRQNSNSNDSKYACNICSSTFVHHLNFAKHQLKVPKYCQRKRETMAKRAKKSVIQLYDGYPEEYDLYYEHGTN